MPVIRYKGKEYGGSPTVTIQSDASATDLENAKVPTGQTVKSYLKSNVYVKSNYIALNNKTLEAGGWLSTGKTKLECTVYMATGKTSANKALTIIPCLVNNTWYLRCLTNDGTPTYASGTVSVEYWYLTV